VSRNKKKKKIAGQNLSLSERLERHWNGEKWETFFSLYMRDREVSERGPWAAKFPDALYNCLTTVLFLHKNYDGARQIAEMMLSESSLGPDGDILRACARIAIDFMDIRAGKSNRPSGDEWRGIALPAPYEELRRKLAEEFAQVHRGRKKKEILNPTVEKLSKQFKALQSAKNIGPYNSFLKSAATLLAEAHGTASEPIFRAVGEMALTMREIAHSTSDARNPLYLVPRRDDKSYPLRTSHPALLTLWEYTCKLGGRKFGDTWESAARAARMSVINSNEEFRPAYNKLMSIGNSSGAELPIAAERYYDGWTEQERFILIFLAVSEQMRKTEGFFEDIADSTALRWFKTLGEIGRRRRSEGAWPMTVKKAFERLIIASDVRYVKLMEREDLPFEYMTTPTIIAMFLHYPRIKKAIMDKLKSHLPLSVNDSDEKTLDDFFPGMVFPVPTLRSASEMLDRRGNEIFFKSILMSIISTDISRMLERHSSRPPLWNSVSQAHIALFAENLPKDSQAAAFCHLCLGQKHMSLSDDTSKIASFFASRPDDNHFNASSLSLFLMTWPGVPAEFLLRLFERSIEGHEHIGEWHVIPVMIAKIQGTDERKSVAQGVSRILKRRYRGKMNAELKRAVNALGALGMSGELPENYDGEYDDFDDHNFDFNEKELFIKKNLDKFRRFFEEINTSSGNSKKQRNQGPQKKKTATEERNKFLFPDEE
jgi:hypothetical protein